MFYELLNGVIFNAISIKISRKFEWSHFCAVSIKFHEIFNRVIFYAVKIISHEILNGVIFDAINMNRVPEPLPSH